MGNICHVARTTLPSLGRDSRRQFACMLTVSFSLTQLSALTTRHSRFTVRPALWNKHPKPSQSILSLSYFNPFSFYPSLRAKCLGRSNVLHSIFHFYLFYSLFPFATARKRFPFLPILSPDPLSPPSLPILSHSADTFS